MEIADKKTQLDILIKLDEQEKKIENLSRMLHSVESFMGFLLDEEVGTKKICQVMGDKSLSWFHQNKQKMVPYGLRKIGSGEGSWKIPVRKLIEFKQRYNGKN